MSTNEAQSWNDLNQFFESQELPQILASLPKMIRQSPNLADLAKSSKTLAELHLNREKDPELKKSIGYALISAYCQMELGKFAPTVAILDWCKKYFFPKSVIEHLAALISETFSDQSTVTSRGTFSTKVKNKKPAAEEGISFPRPNTPLFTKLSPVEARALIDQANSRLIRPGEVVFHEGDDAKAFYILAEGEAGLSSQSGFAKKLSEGDFTGEIAVLSNRKRTATLTATTECRFLEFSKEKLISSFVNFPALEERLLQFYLYRLFLHLAPQHPFFKEYTEDALQHFFYTHRANRVKANTLLIQQEVESSRLFLLLDGKVEISKNKKVIGTLSGGEFFGEMGMLQKKARSAQVMAITPCDYLECPDYLFESLCKQFPKLKPWLESTSKKRVSSELRIND